MKPRPIIKNVEQQQPSVGTSEEWWKLQMEQE